MKKTIILFLTLPILLTSCTQEKTKNKTINKEEEIIGSDESSSEDIEKGTQLDGNSDFTVNVDNSNNVIGSANNDNVQSNNQQDRKTIGGKGAIESKTLNLMSFDEIEVANYCNIEIFKGSNFKVDYSEYENLIEYLQFEVENNKLIVKCKASNISINNSKAKAKIYLANNLTSLTVSGSADAVISSAFNGLKELNITGSGDISCNTATKTTDLSCTITGSGDMNLLKVIATNADCSLAGSGNISLSIQSKLDANIVGSGNINYKGNPTINKNILGSGELINIK